MKETETEVRETFFSLTIHLSNLKLFFDYCHFQEMSPSLTEMLMLLVVFFVVRLRSIKYLDELAVFDTD